MNNEPVAWMEADVLPLTHIIKAVVRREQDEQYTIPLYTHPAKTWQGLTAEEIATIPNDEFRLQKVEKILKERNSPLADLTDEEIEQLQAEYDIDSGLTCHSVKDFARAILRKAQEK